VRPLALLHFLAPNLEVLPSLASLPARTLSHNWAWFLWHALALVHLPLLPLRYCISPLSTFSDKNSFSNQSEKKNRIFPSKKLGRAIVDAEIIRDPPTVHELAGEIFQHAGRVFSFRTSLRPLSQWTHRPRRRPRMRSLRRWTSLWELAVGAVTCCLAGRCPKRSGLLLATVACVRVVPLLAHTWRLSWPTRGLCASHKYTKAQKLCGPRTRGLGHARAVVSG
jgi:hypothetical protein